jgi:hypothetical protein
MGEGRGGAQVDLIRVIEYIEWKSGREKKEEEDKFCKWMR